MGKWFGNSAKKKSKSFSENETVPSENGTAALPPETPTDQRRKPGHRSPGKWIPGVSLCGGDDVVTQTVDTRSKIRGYGASTPEPDDAEPGETSRKASPGPAEDFAWISKLRVRADRQHVPELVVLLDKGVDMRDIQSRLKRRGFSVPIMQEDFCALFVGAKLTRELAIQADIHPNDSGLMPVGFRSLIVQEAIERVVQAGVATADRIFLAHEPTHLNKLKAERHVGVNDLRAYYGSGIGLFFAWSSMYANALFWLSIIAVAVYTHENLAEWKELYYSHTQIIPLAPTSVSTESDGVHAVFLVFMVVLTVWSTIFTEAWKRRSSQLAFEWNNLGKFHEDRMLLRAKKLNEGGGNISMAIWQKMMIVILGYVQIVGCNFYVVMFVQNMMDENPGDLMPIILASVWPLLAGFGNQIVAPVLNHLEGHQTKSSRDQALLTEKFAFSFVNYYGTVLFAAFWKRDLARARSLVFSFLVTKQIITKVISLFFSHYKTAIDRLQKKVSDKLINALFSSGQAANPGPPLAQTGVPQSPDTGAEDNEDVSAAESTLAKPLKPYPDQTDDPKGFETVVQIRKEIHAVDWGFQDEFLDSLVHYGYVAMFTVLCPVAPLFEWINTMVNSTMDLQDLLNARRPPFVRRERLISPYVLTVISTIACLVNVGVLWVCLESDEEQNSHRTHILYSWKALGGQDAFGDLDMDCALTRFLLVLAVEHVCLFFKFFVSELLPDEEAHITNARAQKFYKLYNDCWELRKQRSGEFDFEQDPGLSLQAGVRNTRNKLMNKVAPVFGIPANAMFCTVAACILVSSFKWMPFKLSELWLIPLLFIVLGYYSERKANIDRKAAMGIVSDPDLLEMVIKEMPTWHKQMDTERCEWLNTILATIWPHINVAVSTLVKDDIVGEALKSIPGVRMSEFTLGTVPMKVVGLKGEQTCYDAAHLDLEIKWAGELYARLEIGIKGVPLPIELEDLQLSATLRVKLAPLFPELNPVGGVQITFLDKPHVHFGFNIAGVDAMSLSLGPQLRVAQQVKDRITGILENMMVYPTHLLVYDNNSGYSGTLIKPMPRGILRFTVVKAFNLPRMDTGIRGRLSSDPYVSWRISTDVESNRTKTVKKNHMNPVWEESFELLVYDCSIAVLQFSVFDHDAIGGDDIMGACDIALSGLMPNMEQVHELKLELADGVEDPEQKGMGSPHLYIKTKYIPVMPMQQGEENDHVLYDEGVDDSVIAGDESKHSLSRHQKGAEITNIVGVLAVRGIKIEELKIGGSTHSNDTIYVRIECENDDQETSHKKNTDTQDWLEAFYFIVKEPHTAKIRLTILQRSSGAIQRVNNIGHTLITMNSGHLEDTKLGSVVYKMRDLVDNQGKVDIVGGRKGGTFTDKHTNTSGNITYSLEFSASESRSDRAL